MLWKRHTGQNTFGWVVSDMGYLDPYDLIVLPVL